MRLRRSTPSGTTHGASSRSSILDLLAIGGMVAAAALLVAAVVAPATSDFRTGRSPLVAGDPPVAGRSPGDAVGDVAIEVRPGLRRPLAPPTAAGASDASPPVLLADRVTSGIRISGNTLRAAGGGPVESAPTALAAPPEAPVAAVPTVEAVAPVDAVVTIAPAVVTASVSAPSTRRSARAVRAAVAGADTRRPVSAIRARAVELVVAHITAVVATNVAPNDAAAAAPGAGHRSGRSNASPSAAAR